MVNVHMKELFLHGRMILKLILSCSVYDELYQILLAQFIFH
jgi:hypothetical protein